MIQVGYPWRGRSPPAISETAVSFGPTRLGHTITVRWPGDACNRLVPRRLSQHRTSTAAGGAAPIGTSGADGAAEFERRRGRFWRTGRYERACARLYRCSTSPGIRPLAGTAIPCSVAQARITLGSRLDVLVERDDVVRIDPRRRLDCRSPATGRAAFQYLSSALDSEARFFFDRSISRQSPFHPSRTVSAPSDPSRSSTNTSTVTFAIACLSMPGSTISEGTAAVSWPTATVSCRSRCTATDPVERWPGTIEPSGTG
jgi:hypothetical protein